MLGFTSHTRGPEMALRLSPLMYISDPHATTLSRELKPCMVLCVTGPVYADTAALTSHTPTDVDMHHACQYSSCQCRVRLAKPIRGGVHVCQSELALYSIAVGGVICTMHI